MSIYNKLVQVLYPRRSGAAREVLKLVSGESKYLQNSDSPLSRDWDLWGPFILCLSLALMIGLNAPADQTLGVFTGVIVLISVGSLIVTVQAKVCHSLLIIVWLIYFARSCLVDECALFST